MIMKTPLLVLALCCLLQTEAYIPGLGDFAKADNEYPTFQVGKFLSAIRNHVANEPEQRQTEPKHKHRYEYVRHGDKLMKCIGFFCVRIWPTNSSSTTSTTEGPRGETETTTVKITEEKQAQVDEIEMMARPYGSIPYVAAIVEYNKLMKARKMTSTAPPIQT